MKSGNIPPVIDPEATEYAKTLGHKIDPYFPPVKTDSGIWALDGTASMRTGNNLTKNVNIGNRIFTDDTVTILGHSRYKITSAKDFSSSLSPAQASFLAVLTHNQNPQKNFAKATIDGKIYEGKEILVDKNDIFVDGKLQKIVQENLSNAYKLKK